MHAAKPSRRCAISPWSRSSSRLSARATRGAPAAIPACSRPASATAIPPPSPSLNLLNATSRPRAWIPARCRRVPKRRYPLRPSISAVIRLARDRLRHILAGYSGGASMHRLAALFVAVLAFGGAALAETPVERGSYLVNAIMTCGNCHSPKGPLDVVAGKDFSGGLRFNEPPFDVTAPNITQDKDTGIGKWSAADIKKLLVDNVRPSGVPLVVMPTGFYDIITAGDLDAIVAY